MADRIGKLRKDVGVRARGLCEYCLSPEIISSSDFSIDHILPRSKGGGDDLENLAFCCQGCNNLKYNKTSGEDSVTGELVPLYNPRRQQWKDHFKWSADYLMIEGLTAIGRITVELLKLNRANVINIRKLLRPIGKHPPQGE